MSKEVVEISAGRTAREALQTMRRHGIHHLPVRQGSSLLGIVSESDLRHAVRAHSGGGVFKKVSEADLAPDLKVEDCLTQPLVSVAPDVDLTTAVKRLVDEQVSALAVVKDGKTLGLLTTHDLHKSLINIIKEKDSVGASLLSRLFSASPLSEVLDALSSSGI